MPVVSSYAFRPMFLAAGSWAVVSLVLWFGVFLGYMRLPTRFDPVAWHIHEMLFGFVLAAVAGFLLTAIANWTKRLPVRGYPLALLTGLWLLGRIACLISRDLPAWMAVIADLLFPVALLAVVAREIVAGRNWRNLPMTAPLAVFIVADLLMHFEALGFAVPDGLGWRLGLAAPILLIAVIGGRIIPSFTRNWLSIRQVARLPALHGAVDIAALNAWRLARWAGGATRAEPLLFILHIGYAWIAIGVALLGLSVLGAALPVASAIHALTAGAMATMILAVMPRVTLGHTGRDLIANRPTVAIFVLINAAAISRVCASWPPHAMMLLLGLSAACWIAAFAVFEIVYGPMLLTRQPARPGPSP